MTGKSPRRSSAESESRNLRCAKRGHLVQLIDNGWYAQLLNLELGRWINFVCEFDVNCGGAAESVSHMALDSVLPDDRGMLLEFALP